MLDFAQRQAWQHEGCLVLPGFAAPTTVAGLVAHGHALAARLVEQPGAAAAVFSSRDRARVSDAELMASAATVRAYFEEDAFDAEGRLAVPAARAINKIGHALHDCDPLFSAFSRDARLAVLTHEIGLRDPKLMQSMLIFKQPRIGGEVVWHQDASFLITEPPSVVGLWFALEDATRDNGCLWVAPGGHRGPLREIYERGDDGALSMRTLDTTPWPTGAATRPLEVSAGTLVVFDGRLPHASAPNRSDRSRLAYTLHVVDGRSNWSPRNWLQRPADNPARGFA
jgi:phytanoyl-CoA hydroxylase